ncbi:hypothetical protein [Archangium lansingense]|uniref:Uncharacterized protein n=1 Tax=Archangium lansingense TaxID=2995310 RepID=A0ABT3ZZT8_9BACT|nr:hypothetical protein [Archangium lansinium]MCY1074915.1 hypothetical protein [Archangium lansinium]
MDSTQETSHEVGFGAARGPRPEAAALGWFELLPATQQAMEELINWLYAACRPQQVAGAAEPGSNIQGGEVQLATSALVSGDRGFGKTTILLSTAYALHDPKEFSTPRDAGTPVDPREKERCKRLVSKLSEIREHIFWLDPLDMEPLPTHANLLATLLVRVRNALDVGLELKRKERWAPPSLLEEGLNDPYGRIDKLVRDATFMWEDMPVQGKDPRQRAEHQIKAAEIYATFRRDFREAMESVSRRLAERRFGHGSHEKILLVLPIDNVDRSIQHLHLILKLTRMVASHQLWFVLASGRSEFQLFLERSFQMELTSSGQTLLVPKSREDTLAIARRQAAAAMRRVLPPVHRIQIESVSPRRAWDFNAPAPFRDGRPAAKSLSYFLRKLRLPKTGESSHGLKCFADLFEIRDRLLVWDEEGKVKDTTLLEEYGQVLREQGDYTLADSIRLRVFIESLKAKKDARLVNGSKGSEDAAPPVFSYAARLALTLSARTVLDLWQALKAAVEETERHAEEGHRLPGEFSKKGQDAPCESCDEQSVQIAETMLRAAIDESELPGWASEQLLNRIMRHNAQGRICLDLTGRPVQRLKRTILSDVLEWDYDKHKSAHISLLGTELHLRNFQDVLFELRDLDNPSRKALMPPNVAGWFMLLHDMLVLTPDRRVMNRVAAPEEVIPELTVTLHEAVLHPISAERLDARLRFWWLLPSWNTFTDYVIFIAQWKAFLHKVQVLFQNPHWTSAADKTLAADKFSLVMAAWIDNVCSVAGERLGGWDWRRLPEVPEVPEVEEAKKEKEDLSLRRGNALSDYVREVMGHVEELSNKARGTRADYHRLGIANSWLEHCLPVLLGPEFIPPRSRLPFEQELKKPPSESKDYRWWRRLEEPDSEVLLQRRYDLFRSAVARSKAYRVHKRFHARERGPEARPPRDWLPRCCEEWLSLWEETPPKQKGRIQTQTAHRRGRVPTKRKGPRK